MADEINNTGKVVAHPELQKLIDQSKDELVKQCENLINILEEYKVETVRLSDLADGFEIVSKKLKEERNSLIIILRHFKDIIHEETLSISERYTKLHRYLENLKLPEIGDDNE